ncbi:MAG: hypothetical protein U0S48_14200 [Solirubrobacteraceae bacterium]
MAQTAFPKASSPVTDATDPSSALDDLSDRPEGGEVPRTHEDR